MLEKSARRRPSPTSIGNVGTLRSVALAHDNPISSHDYPSQTLPSFCGRLRPCLPWPCNPIFNLGEVAALMCNCSDELLDRVSHAACALRDTFIACTNLQ